MTQLTPEQIKEVLDDIYATQYIRTQQTHKWVTEDGAYDYSEHQIRLFIHKGFAYRMASRMWVEDEVQNLRLDPWMRAPWGTYPELPPKPPKK